jgi:hypothetical protein
MVIQADYHALEKVYNAGIRKTARLSSLVPGPTVSGTFFIEEKG